MATSNGEACDAIFPSEWRRADLATPKEACAPTLPVAIEEAKAHARELMAETAEVRPGGGGGGGEMDGQTFEIVDEKGLLAATVRFKDALPS